MHFENSSDNLVQKKTTYVTWRLCFASFVAAIGMIQFGWNTGVINNPQTAIKLFINATLVKRGSLMSESNIEVLVAVVVAGFAAGGLVGALVAGWLADSYGRRNGMLINNLVMLIAGVLMLAAPYASSFEMVIIGRIFAGFGSGIYTGIVPVYLNEISPVQIRGAFGILAQLGVVTGLFLSQILGLTVVMGNNSYWNILLGLVIVPAVLQAFLLIFCPYSPKYLLFFKKDEESAQKTLQLLRPRYFDIQSELEEIKADLQHMKTVKKISFGTIVRDKSLRMALLVGVVLHLSQQLSGINNIFYYSSTLFESVQVSKTNSEYSTLGVGAIMIVMTLVSVPLIERTGRRVLHIGGLLGCLIMSVCFTIFYSLISKVVGFNYVSIICALLFVAAFGIGPGSIPWMMIPEMFCEGSRSTASSVGVAVNWFSNLVVGLIFPSLHGALKNLIFIPFIACQLTAIIFLFYKMPETKGLTTSETKRFFDGEEKSTDNTDKENVAKL